MAYNVTQNSHTEPAYSGMYNDFFETGVYHCICCRKSFLILKINSNPQVVGQVLQMLLNPLHYVILKMNLIT